MDIQDVHEYLQRVSRPEMFPYHIVRMAFDHEAEIEHPVLAEAELTGFIAEHYACDNCCSRRTESSSQWNLIVDVDRCLSRKLMFIVASQDIQRSSGNQIAIGIEIDFFGALAMLLTRDATIQLCWGAFLRRYRDLYAEP